MVLAIFHDVHQLTLHYALKGATFTADGTNVGSALLLTAGHLPYDNFVLTQPPGMTILMLPFAWAAHATSTNGAFSAARIVTAVVSVLDVLLVGFVARHRGFAGSIVAGVAFTIYPFAFQSTASAFLEPYLVFFCLAGLLLAFRGGELADGGRLVTAGVLFGYAITIKPWAIVPAAAVMFCASLRWREALGRFAAGVAGGIVVPCIIFFLAAPGAFWRNVVVAELGGGSTVAAPSGGSRLAQLLGLGAPVGISNGRGLAIVVTIVLAVLVVVLTITRIQLILTLDWVVLFTTFVLIVIAFIPSGIPAGYGYFVAAWVAIVVGMVVGNILSLVSALPIGEGVGVTAAAGGGLLFVAIAIGLIAFAVPKEANYERGWFDRNGIDPTPAVDRVVPSGACVLSNDPSVLIVSGRLLGQPAGCPIVIDPAGVTRLAGSSPADRQALATSWEQWMNGAHFVILNPRTGGIPFNHGLSSYFSHNFALAEQSSVDVYASKVAALP